MVQHPRSRVLAYSRISAAPTIVVGNGHRLTFADGENTLSTWMQQNAFVAWVVHPQPRTLEHQRINQSSLPLNLNMNKGHLNVTNEIGRMIRGYYGRLVFKTEIRGNVRLKEAPSFGKSIFDYDKGSTGAEAYRQLTKEVLQRIARET
jgi:hypothetical protein